MKRQAGFTVIELIVTAVILLAASGLFLYQKNQLQAAARDDKRKADINTIYHNLEKVYYVKHKAYPQDLSPKTLSAVHPDTFKDPDGIAINETRVSETPGFAEQRSNYRYEAKDCDLETSKCKKYELSTFLETEADYTKKSAH